MIQIKNPTDGCTDEDRTSPYLSDEESIFLLDEIWETVCCLSSLRSLKNLSLVSKQLRQICSHRLWKVPNFRKQIWSHKLYELLHLPIQFLRSADLNFQAANTQQNHRMDTDQIHRLTAVFAQIPTFRGLHIISCNCREAPYQSSLCYKTSQKITLQQLALLTPFVVSVSTKAILFGKGLETRQQLFELRSVLQSMPLLANVILDKDGRQFTDKEGINIPRLSWKDLELLRVLPITEVHTAAVKFSGKLLNTHPEIGLMHELKQLKSVILNSHLTIKQVNRMKGLPVTHVFLPNLHGDFKENCLLVDELMELGTVTQTDICMDFCLYQQSYLGDFEVEDLLIFSALPITTVRTHHFEIDDTNVHQFICALSALTCLKAVVVDYMYGDLYSLADLRSMKHLPVAAIYLNAIDIRNKNVESFKDLFLSLRGLKALYGLCHVGEFIESALRAHCESILH